MDTKTNNRAGAMGIGVRVLAVVAFLAVAFIGMWGSVKIASAVPGAFSSLAAAVVSITSIFVPANEVIVLSTPSLTVSSDNAFTLSWEHEKKSAEGSYTFRYDCADGVHFASPAISGDAQTIFCNVPFNFLNANDSITLTPFSTKNRFIDVKLYVDFTPNGASKPTVTGSTIITIENSDITGSPATTNTDITVTPPPVTTPTQPTTPSQPSTPTQGPQTSSTYPLGTLPPVSNPNGYVDFSVRILELGVVDKTTGAFTASSSPMRTPPNGRIAVRFAVENLGTKRSPQFDFNAVLPTLPSHIFSSPTQAELGPGDRIEFTLGFDSFVTENEGVFIVNVDPSSRVNEPNKNNNILRYTITVSK